MISFLNKLLTFLKSGSNAVGIFVPLAVMILSFVLTLLLYRHFSRKMSDSE